MMFGLRFITIAILVTAFASGCGDDTVPTCVPGETRDCTCEDLRDGVQTCEDEGTFAACVCSGTTGVSCEGITVSPAPLDFGSVVVGRGEGRSVTIDNNGLEPLDLFEVVWEPDAAEQFRIGTLPPALLQEDGYVEIQSGESFDIGIRFSPTTETSASASLSISHSCGLDMVAVTGVGAPQPTADNSTGIWIRMTWDTPGDPDPNDTGAGTGSDVGLHFLHPNGTWDVSPWDCHWKNKVPNWGDSESNEDDPRLDIDDTDGWGPENITLRIPEGVTYKVGAFYFSDHNYGPSDVTMEIFIDGEIALSHTIFGFANRQFWEAATITWPSREVELVNTLYPSGFP